MSPSPRKANHRAAAAAKAITEWLLGKDQSPVPGQVSRVTLPASCAQGLTSWMTLLNTELTR